MEIMYQMKTKKGEIKNRYYRNLLHSVPSMNVINTIINDFFEGYTESTVTISMVRAMENKKHKESH